MSQCSQEGLDQSNCICLLSGEHRGLGAGVSKVRSLKMDRKVWTETLIQVGVPYESSMLGVASLSCCPPPPSHWPQNFRAGGALW